MEDSNSSKLCSEVKKSSDLLGKVKESFEYPQIKREQTFTRIVDSTNRWMTELNEREITLRKELEDKTNSVNNLEEELSKLKKSNKSQEIMGFKVKVDIAQNENKRLQTLLNTKQEFLEKKRTEKQSKSSSSLEKKLKNEAELNACVNYAQLLISTIEENYIKFSFKSISDAEPEKLLYFTLHLNESNIYEVKSCEPKLADLNLILSQLNKDRNLIAFIKSMRKEFAKVAND